MVREQGLCGLHGAGASRAQHELGALVCHLPPELGDLGVQRLGGLGGLRDGGHLALELDDLRVLSLERLAPLVGSYRFLLVRLGVFARLRFRRVALPLLLLAFRLRAILLTVHLGTSFLLRRAKKNART